MSKRLVTQLFIGSLIAAVGGVVLLLISAGVAWAGGLFIMNGPDVVGVRSTPWGWVLFGLGALAGLLSFGVVGMIVYLIMAPADDDPERVARSTAPAASPTASPGPAHPAPMA